MIIATGADHDNRSHGPGAYLLNHVHAVHIRKSQIHQNNVRASRCRGHDCLIPIGSSHILIILRFQRRRNQVPYRSVILHHQNIRFSIRHHNFTSSTFSSNRNMVPWGTLSYTLILLPWAPTMAWQSASPSPMPLLPSATE